MASGRAILGLRPDENRTNGVGGETEQTSKCGREAQEKNIGTRSCRELLRRRSVQMACLRRIPRVCCFFLATQYKRRFRKKKERPKLTAYQKHPHHQFLFGYLTRTPQVSSRPHHLGGAPYQAPWNMFRRFRAPLRLKTIDCRWRFIGLSRSGMILAIWA